MCQFFVEFLVGMHNSALAHRMASQVLDRFRQALQGQQLLNVQVAEYGLRTLSILCFIINTRWERSLILMLALGANFHLNPMFRGFYLRDEIKDLPNFFING